MHENQISALIGIAFSFWGGLFLYIRPTRYIRKDVLNSISSKALDNLSSVLNATGVKGTPIFISLSTLSDLKDVIMFIPKNDDVIIPNKNYYEKNTITYEEQRGIKLIPTGLDLSKLIEKEINTNFILTDFNKIINSIEKVMVENLELASSIKIEPQESNFRVTINDTIFRNDITENSEIFKYTYAFDPIISSFACILAITSRKSVSIDSYEFDTKNKNQIVVFILKDLIE